MKALHRKPGILALAAAGVFVSVLLVVLSMSQTTLEAIAWQSRVDLILPQAKPPLGQTARVLLATAAATGAALFVLLAGRLIRPPDDGAATAGAANMETGDQAAVTPHTPVNDRLQRLKRPQPLADNPGADCPRAADASPPQQARNQPPAPLTAPSGPAPALDVATAPLSVILDELEARARHYRSSIANSSI